MLRRPSFVLCACLLALAVAQTSESAVVNNDIKAKPIEATVTVAPNKVQATVNVPAANGAPAAKATATESKQVVGGASVEVKKVVATVAPAVNSQAHVTKPASVPASKAPAAVALAVAPKDDCGDAPVNKFCRYLIPICNSAGKISSRHFFKLQSHFKQFVEKTNGKLGICFLENYLIDPSLNPLSRDNLNTICASRKLAPEAKGSFKLFEKCASNNWDPLLEKELDRILAARAKNHQQKPSAAGLAVQNDETSFLNEVVDSIFDHKTGVANDSAELKLFDVTANGSQTGPLVKNLGTAGAVGATSAKGLLKDPNTVVLFMDDTKGVAGQGGVPSPVQIAGPALGAGVAVPLSQQPVAVAGNAAVANAAVQNVAAIADLPAGAARGDSEALSDKIMSSLQDGAAKVMGHSTTGKPGHSTTPKPILAKVKESIGALKGTGTPNPIVAKIKEAIGVGSSTTASPEASKSTHPPSSTAKPVTDKLKEIVGLKSHSTTHAPSKSTTHAPSSTTGSPSSAPTTSQRASTTPAPMVTARVSGDGSSAVAVAGGSASASAGSTTTKKPDEKSSTTAKATSAPTTTTEKPSESVESKVKSAVKSLQNQVSGHKSDKALHQLEHDRQMAMDPIGHTMKHQQYEMSKMSRSGLWV